MKIVKKNQPKICHFYSSEKSLYIAWACFRNVLIKFFQTDGVEQSLLSRFDWSHWSLHCLPLHLHPLETNFFRVKKANLFEFSNDITALKINYHMTSLLFSG